MKLTRKKAIELCIELWTWLALTGKRKEDWPEWKKYGVIFNYCWLCDYSCQRRKANKAYHNSMCDYCPYYKAIGKKCFRFFYNDWNEAKTPRTRKKYAGLFLGQVKTLRELDNEPRDKRSD